MKKLLLSLFVLIPWLTAFLAKPSTFEVTVIGNYLDAISGNSKERINLESLNLGRRNFGLGLEAESNAEILVYKGKVYTSSIDNEGIATDKVKDPVVSYFVYSSIHKWDSYLLPSTIRSMADLETEIEKVIQENEYSETETIPFLLVGSPISANWHIETKPGTSRQINNQGFFFEDKIRAVGFFTNTQQGIITQMNARIHVHVTNNKKEIIGHLDDIKMAGGMTLWMPELRK